MFKSWYFFATCFALFFKTGFCDGQDPASSTNYSLEMDQEASSYVQAMALNAEALRSSDVLVRFESFHDIGPEQYIRIVTLMRMRMDRLSEKMFVLKRMERRTRQTNEEEQRIVSLEGFQFEDQNLRVTQFTGPVSRKKLSFKDAAIYTSLTDLRFVGLKPFPTRSSPLGSFDEYLAASKILTKCVLQSVDTKNVEINRSISTVNAPDEFIHTCWRFNTVTLLPSRFRKEIRRKESGMPVVYPTCRESYSWEETNGAFVPTRIDGVEPGNLKNVEGGKPIKYQIENTAQFHWFSVNEQMDNKLFSADPLDSFGDCFPLLDPKLSNATTIVE